MQVLFKGLQLVREIILRIIELELLYDMGMFFTRHTRLSSIFDLRGSSHAVLAVFSDWHKIPSFILHLHTNGAGGL